MPTPCGLMVDYLDPLWHFDLTLIVITPTQQLSLTLLAHDVLVAMGVVVLLDTGVVISYFSAQDYLFNLVECDGGRGSHLTRQG